MVKNLALHILLVVLAMPVLARASGPVIYFTDITSGPSTGNSDGLGDGAIVTVWGTNLGSSIGGSAITIGGLEPSYIYYWKDADGTLPGGPADLYTSHNMQEIAFSLPSTLADGVHDIQVTVAGVVSNSLQYTVRAGNIYFVKPTGNDSSDGSWGSPWQTLAETFSGGNGKLAAGDIVYSVDCGSSVGLRLGAVDTVAGVAGSPIALSVYPGTSCAISGNGGDNAVVANYYPAARNNQYIDISKISVTAYGNDPEWPNAFTVVPHGRIVGVEITGPNVYGGYGGAITGTNGVPQGGVYLGVYIHDYGYDNGWNYDPDTTTWTSPPYDGIAGIDCTNCTTTDRFQHLYYISCREGGQTCEGYEVGWNNLSNNHILHGLHVYDLGVDGGWNGEIVLHDNYVYNQLGAGLDAAMTDVSTATLKIYNNIFKNINGNALDIRNTGSGLSTIYNNTIYDQTVASSLTAADEFVNNIIYSSSGLFVSNLPALYSNNLCFQPLAETVPSWCDVGADPLFISAANLALQPASPAIDAGATTTLVSSDFIGVDRPQGSAYDIGAYEFTDSLGPTRSAGSPTTQQQSGTTQVTLSVTTDVAATCTYGADGVTGVAYPLANSMTTADSLTHTALITGLTDGGSYSRSIRCAKTSDSEANDTDYTLSWSVATAGTPSRRRCGSRPALH